MDRIREHRLLQRRTFLGHSARGLGVMALASLIGPEAAMAGPKDDRWRGVVSPPHVAPKARRVIFLSMAGGPSHLETLDYKPKLAAMNGEPMPGSFTAGMPIAQLQGQALKCLGPQHAFKKFGNSGQEICELFPNLGGVADEICIVRSIVTEAINHDPAHTFMNTGTTISGRPSMGSWVTYGLGSESDDLPGFVVLTSNGRGGQNQPIASRQWHSGFLPSRFQGVHLRGKGDPVLYLTRPDGVGIDQQRDVIDAVRELNQAREATVEDPEIATRISQYEMAFKMQASVPGLMDVSGEPQEVLDLYGTKGADGSFAANCLLARRLAERGVRFIQLYHRDWDHHGNVRDEIKLKAEEVDRASAALPHRPEATRDAGRHARGLGRRVRPDPDGAGEWPRPPHQGVLDVAGRRRDQGGISHGQTDDLGYAAVENIVPVHDLHATMLHLLGVDHKRLTYKFQGRDFRLTDVKGDVVRPILA